MPPWIFPQPLDEDRCEVCTVELSRNKTSCVMNEWLSSKELKAAGRPQFGEQVHLLSLSPDPLEYRLECLSPLVGRPSVGREVERTNRRNN